MIVLLNRFTFPSNGKDSDDSFPWHEAKGADDPENVNRALPESIQDWLRHRYADVPRGVETRTVEQALREELDFIASLPEMNEADAEFARTMRDCWVNRLCRTCAEGALRTDPAMRRELEADLEMLNDSPEPSIARSGLASCMIQAYLRGRYRADPAMREDVRRQLQRLRFENLTEEDSQKKVMEVIVPYANGRWGVQGAEATEAGSRQ